MSDSKSSIGITDPEFIKKIVDDPNFPFLVSFPRTGSHWLRMIMELYFQKPSLVRVFYYKDCQDYLTFHTHDIELDVQRKNVIYLYRNPVPTIYSQMMYEKDNINDNNRIRYWATLYGKHLKKWLIEETESDKKTIVCYEFMVNNFTSEFKKITEHFAVDLELEKLRLAISKVSINQVKQKTKHDRKVISRSIFYKKKFNYFAHKYAELIMDITLKQDCRLSNYIHK